MQTDPEHLLAGHIKVTRQERGWSQAELASRLSELGMTVHATGITRIESGKRGVSLNEFCLIAVALEMMPEELLNSLRTQAEVGVGLEAGLKDLEDNPPTPLDTAVMVEHILGIAHGMIRDALDKAGASRSGPLFEGAADG